MPKTGFLNKVGSLLYGNVEGALDTISFGLTDKMTDKLWTDVVNKKGAENLNQFRGAGNMAGAVAGGILTGNVSGAIEEGLEGFGSIAANSQNEKFQKAEKFANMAAQLSGFASGANKFTNFGSQMGNIASMPQVSQPIGQINSLLTSQPKMPSTNVPKDVVYSSKQSTNYAAGGPIKPKPIFVSSLNDPRLQRYNDSADLYNYYNIQRSLESRNDFSNASWFDLNFLGASDLTPSGIQRQKQLNQQALSILSKNPRLRTGLYSAGYVPLASYNGRTIDINHPNIKPRGQWFGIAYNNDYSNVKPKQEVIYNPTPPTPVVSNTKPKPKPKPPVAKVKKPISLSPPVKESVVKTTPVATSTTTPTTTTPTKPKTTTPSLDAIRQAQQERIYVIPRGGAPIDPATGKLRLERVTPQQAGTRQRYDVNGNRIMALGGVVEEDPPTKKIVYNKNDEKLLDYTWLSKKYTEAPTLEERLANPEKLWVTDDRDSTHGYINSSYIKYAPTLNSDSHYKELKVCDECGWDDEMVNVWKNAFPGIKGFYTTPSGHRHYVLDAPTEIVEYQEPPKIKNVWGEQIYTPNTDVYNIAQKRKDGQLYDHRYVIEQEDGSLIELPNAEQYKRYKEKYGLGNDLPVKYGRMPYFNSTPVITTFEDGGPVKSPVIKDYDRDEAPRQGNYLLPDINRPGYVNALNQLRTEYRMGINDPRLNKEVLIPTVINGMQFSPDAAVDRYYNTGYHMGMFDTPEQAKLASMLRTQKYNTLIDPVRTPSVLQFKKGGMIKRADGSYSKRGLWDNLRANRGSGKKPTAEMLKQERKIKRKS